MTLYKGKEKVSPIVNVGSTIKNQKITVTKNGNYSCDEGYTGLSVVKVRVPPREMQEKQIEITENTTTEITPDEWADGLSKVTVETNIPLQEKVYQITATDLNSNLITIVPDEGKTAMTKVVLDLSEIVRLLSEI